MSCTIRDDGARQALQILILADALISNFTADDENNERMFYVLSKVLKIKIGYILMPLRVAVTGSKISPPLFQSIKLLGKEKTHERIMKAVGVLENYLREE